MIKTEQCLAFSDAGAVWTDEPNSFGRGSLYTYTTATASELVLSSFDFSGLPSLPLIGGIEVFVKTQKDETGGSGTLTLQFDLSGAGGGSWVGAKTVTLSTTATEATLGSSTDDWSKGSWSRAELVNDNFQIKITSGGSGITGSPEWRLMYAVARVHYTDYTALTYTTSEQISVKDGAILSDSFGGIQTLLSYEHREAVDCFDAGPSSKPSVVNAETSISPDPLALSSLADFQAAIESTDSKHAFSVHLEMGSKVLLVSEPVMAHDPNTTLFQEGLLEIPEITYSGAAGTDSASNVGTASFSISSDVLESITTAEIKTAAELAQTEGLVGSTVIIRAHAKTASTGDFESIVLFRGYVEDALFAEDRVEFYCKSETISTEIFPSLKFKESWFSSAYGDAAHITDNMGGEAAEKADDATMPIGMGRFDATAIKKDYTAGHPLALESNGRSDIAAVLPQMLGVLHPVVPMVALWRDATPFDWATIGYTPIFNVLAYGDSRSVLEGYGGFRLETTHENANNLIYPGPLSAASYEVGEPFDVRGDRGADPLTVFWIDPRHWRYGYTALTTWATEGSRAQPFLFDVSRRWTQASGEFLSQHFYNGVKPVENLQNLFQDRIIGDGGSQIYPVLFAAKAGITPTWSYQDILSQTTALKLEAGAGYGSRTELDMRQDGLGMTTEYYPSGFPPSHSDHYVPYIQWVDGTRFLEFTTTAGVTDAEACTEISDMESYTTIPNGESLTLRLPTKATSKGKIKAIKVSWLVDGSQANRASRVYFAARQSPGVLFPLMKPDLNTNYVPSGGSPNEDWLGFSMLDGTKTNPFGFDGFLYWDCPIALEFDSSQHLHGSVWLSARQFAGESALKQSTYNDEVKWRSHGFANPESWEFVSYGAERREIDDGIFRTLTNVLYRPEVTFWVGDPKWNEGTGHFTDDTGKSLHLLAVWLEVVYESPLRESVDEWAPIAQEFTQRQQSARSTSSGRQLYWWDRFTLKSNLDPRKPARGSALSPVWVAGRGPYGDAYGRLAPPSTVYTEAYPNYTGATTGGQSYEDEVVERGVDQVALAILHTSQKAWNDRAVGTDTAPSSATPGSFEQARFLTSKWSGELDKHRLATIFKDEGTLGEAVDRIARQSMAFSQEQINYETGALQWRYFVDSVDLETSQPERLYRTDGYSFKLDDMYPNTFTARVTPIDQIGNNFTLRYGLHLPSNKWASTAFCNHEDTSITQSPGTYTDACALSKRLYGERKDIIEAPDVWDSAAAEALLKWHVASKVRRRTLIEFSTFLNAIDLQPGMLITINDEMADRVKYPGYFGSAWSTQYFVVTRVVIQKDLRRPAKVQVTALEAYPSPPIPLP